MRPYNEDNDPYEPNKRLVGQKLINLLFYKGDKGYDYNYLYELINYAGLHRQLVGRNVNMVDAFTSLCNYAYGNTDMSGVYDATPRDKKYVVINQVKDHLIRRFAVFFAAEGGVRKRRIKKQRRSNIRRSNKKYKFNRTKRKLL
jgi:hypothetical protein